jgi:flagellar protein FliL
MDAADENEALAATAPPPKSGGKGLTVAAVALLVIGAGGGAAWYLGGPPFAGSGADVEQQVEAPPIYFTLDPNMIVNFDGGGRVRYLQLGIELMTREPKAVDALQLHAPVLRNNLIMLLSDRPYDTLVTREGKETLREAALAEVQSVMTERYGRPAVETLYFTSFVMQ